uniref:Tonneau 1b n=1 Tax=Zea mays TaxID=4577 RepID=B6U9F3_MAIZE|nr:tonneau 1b [Zea mays]
MDDYAREMMELKTLVTRTLEKKGVLAKIRAELRASVFEAIEEEDRVMENDDGGNPALLGSCNDRAKQLHASPSECNLPKDFWKNELKDFSNKSGAEGSRSAESGPLLLDVLEGYLKYENLSQPRMGGRRMMSSESDPSLNAEHRSMRRAPSASVGNLPPMGRPISSSQQASDRRGGSSVSNTRKDEYNWRYDTTDDISEEVLRASTALESVQLDRKSRNLPTSWRHSGDGAE